MAVVKANNKMATEQLNLLLEICFFKRNKAYEPVMIQMVMRKTNIETDPFSGEVTTSVSEIVFEVPLITILPLSSLAVEHIDIEMGMEIHTQIDIDEDTERPALLPASKLQRKRNIALAGSLQASPKPSSKNEDVSESISTNVSINVNAGQLPLPLGLTTVLDAYSKTIFVVDDKDNRDPS